eukprot:12323471-Alexandrium_andersonii.AAC.1
MTQGHALTSVPKTFVGHTELRGASGKFGPLLAASPRSQQLSNLALPLSMVSKNSAATSSGREN